ncbi:type II secretion system GspH family protein [Peptococcaceae bacterium]|nr:type II secretion system GspH family protein [Peptococcaceae bacterium]
MKQRNEKTAKQHVGADSRACPGSVNKSLLAKIKNDQRGLTLLEVVLAMAIASLVILPASMLLVNTVKAYNIVDERVDAMISIPVSEEHRTIGDVLTQFRQDVNVDPDSDLWVGITINEGPGLTTDLDSGIGARWRWHARDLNPNDDIFPTYNLTRELVGSNTPVVMLENVHKVTFVKYRERLGGTGVRRYIRSWDRANGTSISYQTDESPSPFPYPDFKSTWGAEWRGEMIIELRPGGPGTPLIVYRAGATSRMWHNEEMN